MTQREIKGMEELIKEIQKKMGWCDGDDKHSACSCRKEIKVVQKALESAYKKGVEDSMGCVKDMIEI